MNQVISAHLNATSYTFCIYPGNGSNFLKKHFEANKEEWSEIQSEDERQAMQLANFIWKQNDLSTQNSTFWESTNARLKIHGL
jgi:hypothetical protein